MTARRLVTTEQVARWSDQLHAAMGRAGVRQHRTIGATLKANGLTWDTPARTSTVDLWPAASWASAVDAELAPVAAKVAADVLRAVRSQVPARLHYGMGDHTPRLAAMVVDRALAGGPGIARRLSGSLTAAGVDLEAVKAKIDAAEPLPLHPTNQPTLGTAYQQAYEALDQIVANTGAHLSDAAAAILGETAAANTGADVTHTWRSAFAPTSRPEHMDADGQEQNAGDGFDVGDETLAFPGDPSGSDGATINCMCWLETNLPDVAGVSADESDVA